MSSITAAEVRQNLKEIRKEVNKGKQVFVTLYGEFVGLFLPLKMVNSSFKTTTISNSDFRDSFADCIEQIERKEVDGFILTSHGKPKMAFVKLDV